MNPKSTMNLQDEIKVEWTGHQRTQNDHFIETQTTILIVTHLKSRALDAKFEKSLM
jgi:hypothetical protein